MRRHRHGLSILGVGLQAVAPSSGGPRLPRPGAGASRASPQSPPEQARFAIALARPAGLRAGGPGWVCQPLLGRSGHGAHRVVGGRSQRPRTVFQPRASQPRVLPTLVAAGGGRTRLCRGGPVSGGANLLGVSAACHICINLKLSWWSSVSGMSVVGLAHYSFRFAICVD